MENSVNTNLLTTDEATACDPSHLPQIAALKRVFELWLMDREFHDACLVDAEQAIAATGLSVDPRAARLVLRLDTFDANDSSELPETYIWYRDFVEGRMRRTLMKRAQYVPNDPRFRDWNLRQRKRCIREQGPRALYMNNLPVVFELTSGCSVGCPFCGVSSGKFKGVFRHTDENAALWQDVLARLHRSVGDVVGNAICYYATEPLDNPDYELFIEDFYNEFGQVPSTTTALALRNVERTRNLLQWGQRIPGHTDRISVLSSQDFETIITTFTPEELVFTDLLPHFEEAPVCALRRAGRNRDAAQGNEETISCVSGFVVNMWERSVRLLTPTLVNDEHPTGELILETASFTDGASLEKAISDMVGRHMHETIGIADILGVKQKP